MLLNKTVQYTTTGRGEVYCSAPCRDNTFFGDNHEAEKHSTPGKWVYCASTLEGKRRGALYCDEICKKRAAKKTRAQSTAEPQIAGTPTQLHQGVGGAKIVEQGNRIAKPSHTSRMALADSNPLTRHRSITAAKPRLSVTGHMLPKIFVSEKRKESSDPPNFDGD